MYEIGLDNRGIQTDFLGELPQDPQHHVHCGQEVGHWLVQARLSLDHMQHYAIAQKNHGIDGGEEDGDPWILLLQARKSTETEGEEILTWVIEAITLELKYVFQAARMFISKKKFQFQVS